MNIKVTVELEEGVSSTGTIHITAEQILLLFCNDDSIKRDNYFMTLAQNSAARQMKNILVFFKKNKSLVVTRTVNEDGVETRESHVVKDVNTANQWMANKVGPNDY